MSLAQLIEPGTTTTTIQQGQIFTAKWKILQTDIDTADTYCGFDIVWNDSVTGDPYARSLLITGEPNVLSFFETRTLLVFRTAYVICPNTIQPGSVYRVRMIVMNAAGDTIEYDDSPYITITA